MRRINGLIGFIFFVNLICITYLSIIEDSIAIIGVWTILFILAFFFSYLLKRLRLFLLTWSIGICFMTFLAIDYSRSYGNFYWGGGSDELNYERDAIYFSKNYGVFDYAEIKGGIVRESHNSVGYIYLVGLEVKLSSLFGKFSTFVPRMFNLFFYVLIVLIFSLLLENFFKGSNYTILFSYLFALDMFNLWVSVQVFRDIVQLFFTMVGVYITMKILDSPRFDLRGAFLFFLVSLLSFVMIGFREYQALLFFLVNLFVVFYHHTNKYLRFFFIGISSVVLFQFGVKYFDFAVFDAIVMSAENYSSLRTSDRGLSRFIIEQSFLPYGWLLRILYGFVSPLPVIFHPVYMSFISFSSVLHILLVPFFFIGLTRINSIRLYYISILFLAFFLPIVFISITFRQMVQYMPFFYIICFLGLKDYKRVKSVFLLELILLSILLLIYLYIKN